MADRIDTRARYLRDFAAALCHEFKTPLTGIRGALELLGEHTMTDAERQRFLANAGADADRLALLVHRLLELARADMATTQAGHCALRHVVSGLDDVGISIVLQDDGDVPIGAELLTAVLRILAQNSRQAGARTATLRLDHHPTAVSIRYEDDGHGIPAGDRDRVFTPFFTSRRLHGGTGLGLPIARSLLSAGKAAIDLLPSTQGATLVLTFPAGRSFVREKIRPNR
jgi:two-component system sensor histidine kinase ChvG